MSGSVKELGKFLKEFPRSGEHVVEGGVGS